MQTHRVRGPRVAYGLLWFALTALVLSTIGASAALAEPAASSVADSSSGAHAALAATPFLAPTDPPAIEPRLVATVPVGTYPTAAIVDPTTGLAYVADTVGNQVSVLDGTSVVATINLTLNNTGTPRALVYDASDGYVYVVDAVNFETGAGAVNVVRGTTVIDTLPIGGSPDAAVVDPVTGDVYVTNSGTDNVSVVSGTTELDPIPVGSDPVSLAYDVYDAYVYVANSVSNNVSLLFADHVVGSLPAGSGPVSIAYDPLDSEIYVANSLSDNVSILEGIYVAGSVPVGAAPSYVAFNPSVGGVEVTNNATNDLTIVNGTSAVVTVGVGSGPVWVGAGPSGVYTFVANWAGGTVTVLEGSSAFGSTPVGNLPTSGVGDPVNELEYISVAGANDVAVFAVTYPVTFNETGLATGTSWSVELDASSNSSTSSSIGFFEPAGTYAYTIGTPSGYVLVSATPASPITVLNASVLVNVIFAPAPSGSYNLTFEETGLGRSCQGMGDGTDMGNGQGGQGSQGGSGSCCMGSSTAPAWSVTVANLTQTTTNSSIVFVEPDGTYAYTITPPSGYQVTSTSPSSPVTIDGANVTVSVTFGAAAPSTFSVTFQEVGLSEGTVWCVQLGATECSSGREIVFGNLTSGTYGFAVAPVAKFTASPSQGTVRLVDRDVSVVIRFTSTSHHGCGP